MTGFASYIFKFILSVRLRSCLNHFVAIVAGNILVFAVERESCFIVIKISKCPIAGVVASGTISKPVNSILASVIIFMTTGAGLGYTGKFQNLWIVAFAFGMTRTTCLLFVCSADCKFSLCMIKRNLTPAIFRMAFGAVGFRVIFYIYIAGMNILVTIAAAIPDIPE